MFKSRSYPCWIFVFSLIQALFFYHQSLYSQEADQDSIFNAITSIRQVHDQNNQRYFTVNSPMELRFDRLNAQGKPVHYIDLLRDTIAYPPSEYVITFQDTAIISPSFLPLVYDGKLMYDSSIHIKPLVQSKPEFPVLSTLKVPFSDTHLRDSLNWEAYAYALTTAPHLVKYTKDDFPEEIEKTEEMKVDVFQNMFKVDNSPDFSQVDKIDRFIPKRKYWVPAATTLIQFSQSYISENWYKGGVGNLSLLSRQHAETKYEKNKILFNTTLDWNLSFYTVPKEKDSLRTVRIGEDLIRSYSSFSIKAFNKWYYSSTLEMKTQFFNNYKENTTTLVSTFMSPLNINMGILGMTYQYNKSYKDNKYKSLSLTLNVSPFSARYIYVGNDKVDPTRHGIPKGESRLFDFGSKIDGRLIINFSKNVNLNSRFYYYTNYENVVIESENTLNMPLNRFFSTRIYLYARFDDTKGLPKDPKLGRLQINELLSFGFNYVW